MKFRTAYGEKRKVVTKPKGKSLTEQHHKKSCDINNILAKYAKTGLVDHVASHEATYGDFTGADFQAAQNLIAEQQSIFNQLPAAVRNKFDNDPAQYLDLVASEGGVDTLREILNPEEPEQEQFALEGESEPPAEAETVTETVT